MFSIMTIVIIYVLIKSTVQENYFNAYLGLSTNRTNSVKDINLRFYNGNSTEQYVDIPLNQAINILDIEGFDKSNPTVLYTHGFIANPQDESIHVMASAYLDARPDTNFVLLDWSNMAHGPYTSNAAPNTKKVGAAAAEQIHKLIAAGLLLNKLHLIGHSLGSHIAGYLARDLKNKYNEFVKRISALDPAFEEFYPDVFTLEHVCESDAEFVDVIHTDAGIYGAPVRTGTVDFWPNNGRQQPGCPLLAPIPFTASNACNHFRSWRFFAESVRTPETFPASPANSYDKFKENPTPEVGMVYMGADCGLGARGSYYLTTNAQTPYGKGMDGIKPHDQTKLNPILIVKL